VHDVKPEAKGARHSTRIKENYLSTISANVQVTKKMSVITLTCYT